MEPHPENGKVILQVFGDSSHSYQINGTTLAHGRTELLEGFYTVTSNSVENSIQLNLSSAVSCGYVLGLFQSPQNKLVHFEHFSFSFIKHHYMHLFSNRHFYYFCSFNFSGAASPSFPIAVRKLKAVEHAYIYQYRMIPI